jgi:hypothetical protein
MDLLLHDQFEPITSQIGFLESRVDRVVESFVEWMKSLNIEVAARKVNARLPEALSSLLPLTTPVRRRHLFVQTAGDWSAFFDNGLLGTDAASLASVLAQRLGCRGLRALAVPDTIAKRDLRGRERARYGGTILEIYGAAQTGFLNSIRSISVVNDGGKWSFDVAGTVQPFEDTQAYRTRRIQDRFSPERLRDYLAALGVRAFDEDFYLSQTGAILVENVGPAPASLREVGLSELGDYYRKKRG